MFKSFFTQNLAIKLFALLLAVITWFAVRAAISFEMVLADVPVEIRLSPGWAILSRSENTVQVTVRGAQDTVRGMPQDRIRAEVDLRGIDQAGTVDVKIENKNIIGVESGVRVVRLAPEFLHVTLGNEVTRRLPVQGKVTGKPLVGNVESVVCDPPVVTIHGPEQMLDYTEWLSTTPVEVDGRIQSFSKRCRVLPPGGAWAPKIEPPEVMVTVNIVQREETMEWDNIPVSIMALPGKEWRARVEPAQVKVRVTGTSETLGAMSNIRPHVFVDCSGLDPSLVYDLPVSIYLPSRFEVVSSAEPAFVRFVPEPR